jgi:tetratricopeptide (TPR) repeat protein
LAQEGNRPAQSQPVNVGAARRSHPFDARNCIARGQLLVSIVWQFAGGSRATGMPDNSWSSARQGADIAMPSMRILLIAGLATMAFGGSTLPSLADLPLPMADELGICTNPTPRQPYHAADLNSKLLQTANCPGVAAPPIEHAGVIDAMRQGYGPPEPSLFLNRQAILYWTTGRYGAAELLLKRAIVIDEKTHGCDYPGLATSLDNLAGLYQATAHHDMAEPLLERAVAIGLKAHGPEHPNLASRLNNLAVLYWATGRQDAAEPLFARALAILKKRLPPAHPVLTAIRENYVHLLAQLGQSREGLQAAVSAQGIRQRREVSPSWCG